MVMPQTVNLYYVSSTLTLTAYCLHSLLEIFVINISTIYFLYGFRVANFYGY